MYSLYAFICTSPVLVRQDCWGIMCHSGFLYQITCRSHDDDIIVYMTLQCYVNEGRLTVYCFTYVECLWVECLWVVHWVLI